MQLPFKQALAIIGLVAAAAGVNDTAKALEVPPSIQGRSLTDGTPVKVNPRDGSELTVLVFMSARCPCSASHEPSLARLAKEFSKEARFVGVHSNSDEPEAESAAHFKKAALPFPVIQDTGARLADAFGAMKTPHAYVLAKNGEVLFQGGVDDSHDATRAKRLYLKDALEALRLGHAPPTPVARSLGCLIRR